MNGKRIFYTEWAYAAGLLSLALGTALMQRANFGMSMVVAPAYLLHLRIARIFPAFSFGMAEYCLQAALLAVLALVVQRVKLKYFLSFGTTILYGLLLDGCAALIGLIPVASLAVRALCYLLGMACCVAGISLLFHTYLPPEAYELFVKEVAEKFQKNIGRVKTAYDCISCLAAILLSFAFFGFGQFEGVKLGTILCALVNGACIGACSKVLEKNFVFRDALPVRAFFDGERSTAGAQRD